MFTVVVTFSISDELTNYVLEPDCIFFFLFFFLGGGGRGQKKNNKKQNGTENPGDEPPFPRAPGKKTRRSGEPLT